ncbi:hypothetical protein L6164_031717 [Bauhinia variegata]|uniref:Uncharacterized protein n=1 Tax=Bauhinia variegata TaxID=167791 RepID=A0ACB9LGY0_BAUVA|nr:hypothetical protein L6164_031717 [Bauhinia variegata]
MSTTGSGPLSNSVEVKKRMRTEIERMGFEALQMILTKSLSIIAWPPFSLLFPIYASIRTMESDCRSRKQRCLAFWVIFSLFKIIESELAVLLNWTPWWTHVKGMATILLVLPYFGSASYVYNYFIKRYFTDNICTRISDILFSQISASSTLDGHLIDVSDGTTIKTEIERKQLIVYQGRYETYDRGSDLIRSCDTKPTGKNEVQKEWSCALCQISTTSENCLGTHLKGKKHKAMEKELRAELRLLVTNKRTKGLVLLENLNQIANFLTPVSRSIRWCEWTKPDFGWTKLNTDGSINGKNASCGGLLRDYRGEPICAFVSKVPRGDIFLVELWAIWRGLVLALGLGVKVIWVESDSMSVVKNITKEQPTNPKAASCLKRIWKLLNEFEKHKVSHSWRETNRAADHLAKMFLQGNDVVLWPSDFPNSLCNIIRNDAKGKKYLRW